jgi:NAD(P)-dependent dehydrogenase (short-subunit alcohol dehydrogenase family)
MTSDSRSVLITGAGAGIGAATAATVAAAGAPVYLADVPPSRLDGTARQIDSTHVSVHIPARRGGMPDEVGASIFFIATPGAAYINGDVIHIDGGWIAS